MRIFGQMHKHKWTKIGGYEKSDGTYKHNKFVCSCSAEKHTLKRPQRKEIVKVIPPRSGNVDK